MFNVAIVIDAAESFNDLKSEFIKEGFACSLVSWDVAYEHTTEQAYNLIVLSLKDSSNMHQLAKRLRQEGKQPVIAVITKEMLDNSFDVDDFVVKPYDIRELILRVKGLIHAQTSTHKLIKYNELVIDPAEYQVAVAGRLIELTFKEYELLKFLALNPGRVFTRESLLDKVWGYDYFGGDRTVDVHIRRLRSKIEDAEHTYIETIRSVGYRFRKEA